MTDNHVPCYQVKTGDDEWVLIPGCWGALYRPKACTCYPTGSELEEAIARRDEAELHIGRMKVRGAERATRLNDMFHRNKVLSYKVRELEAQIAATGAQENT